MLKRLSMQHRCISHRCGSATAHSQLQLLQQTHTWCQFFTGLGTFLPRTCDREAGQKSLDWHSGDGHAEVQTSLHTPTSVG